MPSQTLAPEAILEQTNLLGTVLTVQNDPDTPDGIWMTAVDKTLATSLRVSFPAPGGAISGNQEFRARVRKVGGTDSPPCSLELWVAGTLRTSFPAVNVSSTTGVVLSAVWDGQGINGADVELRVNSPSTGGSPKARATCEIEGVEWNAFVAEPPPDPPTNLTATADSDSISLAWNAPVAGTPVESYKLYRSGENLLRGDDSTFTNSIGGWIGSSSTLTHSIDRMRVEYTATSAGAAFSQWFPISPGQTVYARGLVRNLVGTRYSGVTIQFQDTAGALSTFGTSSITSNVYEEKSHTIVAPASAVYVRVRLLGSATTSSGSSAIGDAQEWDDIVLKVYETVVGPNSLTGDNSTFTNSVGNWTTNGFAALSNPSQVLRITTTGTEIGIGYSPQIPVVPGEVVNAAVDVRTVAGTRTVTLGLEWRTSAGAFISRVNDTAATPGTTFGRRTLTATAPATAAYGVMRVNIDTGVANDAVEADNAFFSTALKVTTTSYDDVSVQPGITYTYFARSVNSNGESSDSNLAAATVLLAAKRYAGFGIQL